MKTYRVSGYEKVFFSVDVEAESWEAAVYAAYGVPQHERSYGDESSGEEVMDCVDLLEDGAVTENVASLSCCTWFGDDGSILKEDYEL